MTSYYRNTKTNRVISSTGPMYKKLLKEGVELILLPASTKEEAVKVNHSDFYVKKRINYRVPDAKKFFNTVTKRIVKEGSKRYLETPKNLLRPIWIDGRENPVVPVKVLVRQEKPIMKKIDYVPTPLAKKSGKIDFIPTVGLAKQIPEITGIDISGYEPSIDRMKIKGSHKKIKFIPKTGKPKKLQEIVWLDVPQGDFPISKDLVILSPREKAIRALPAVMNVIYQRQTIITFPMYGPTGDVRFYSIPVLRLIRVGATKWDREHALDVLTKFYKDPGSFKANHIMDVENYLEEKRSLKGEVQYMGYDGYEPDSIPLNTNNDNEERSDADMNAAMQDMFRGEYGARVKGKFMRYDQINDEEVKGSCFYNSMSYYGVKNPLLQKVTAKKEVINWLNKSEFDYIIYEDCIKPTRESISKNLKPGSECIKVYKKRESLYFGLDIPNKILFSRITANSGRTPLIFAITYNTASKIDHIYVPDMVSNQNLYTAESFHNVYREIDGKMVSIMSILQKTSFNYIYYDLETVSDYKNSRFFRPVSMSVCSIKLPSTILHTKTESNIINHLKMNQETGFIIERGSNDSKLDEIPGAKIVEKLDVWNELKSYIDPNSINKICSFNGANFDNVFLLKSIFDNKVHVNVTVSGGRVEIRNVKTSDLNFSTYDIARFVGPGSLEMHCNNYIKNPTYRKKAMKAIFGKLDEMYDKGFVTSDIPFMTELMRYNDLDVESLAILHCSFLRSFNQILAVKPEDKPTIATKRPMLQNDIRGGPKMEREFNNCVSLPQFMYKLFSAMNSGNDKKGYPEKFAVPSGMSWKKAELVKDEDGDWIDKKDGISEDSEHEIEKLAEKPPTDSVNGRWTDDPKILAKNMDVLKEYEILRQKKTGGRCECVPSKYLDKDYNCRSLDVASLYPFAMLCYNKSQFMVGRLERTDKYVEHRAGVYIGTVTQVRTPEQQTLFYCEKTAAGNNWDCWDRPVTALMTSIDIEEVIKKNPAWSFTIDFGYYTEYSKPGTEVFKCLIPFMREKTRQDVLSGKKHPDANPALRNACKVAMNSLSGKFLQSLARFEYEVTEGLLPVIDEEIEKFYSLTRRKYSETSYLCSSLHADKRLHVGVFIYALSKLYMYQNVYGCLPRSSFVYTDTDSSKIMDDKVFDEWMEIRGKTNMEEYLHPEVYDMGLGYTPDTRMFYDKTGVKCVGQLEDENHGMGYNRAIYCEKKEYMTWNSETFDHKIMMKGVNLKNFVCLEYNELIGLGGDTPLNIYYRQARTGKKFTIAEYEVDKELDCTLMCEVNQKCYDDPTLFGRLDTMMGEALDSRTKRQKVEQVAKMFERRMDAKALITDETTSKEQKRIRQMAKSFILMKVFRRSLLTCRIRVEYIVKKI